MVEDYILCDPINMLNVFYRFHRKKAAYFENSGKEGVISVNFVVVLKTYILIIHLKMDQQYAHNWSATINVGLKNIDISVLKSAFTCFFKSNSRLSGCRGASALN